MTLQLLCISYTDMIKDKKCPECVNLISNILCVLFGLFHVALLLIELNAPMQMEYQQSWCFLRKYLIFTGQNSQILYQLVLPTKPNLI